MRHLPKVSRANATVNSNLTQTDLTHYHLPHPFLQLCTENLTPFLSLLPSKGVSGISALLAQPGIVLSWGFKTEGIEVVMPSASMNAQGRWRGWWEGVVDLVPEKGGSRAFSIQSLFKKNLPRPFPEADSSVLRVIKPLVGAEGKREWMMMEPQPGKVDERWEDGVYREVAEWDLLSGTSGDVRFWWDNEGDFIYRE